MHCKIITRLRTGFLILITGIVAFLAASCASDKIREADLIGTWIPSQESRKWIKSEVDIPKCQLVLRPDGTFSGAVSDYMMESSDKASGKLMIGKGNWSLFQDPGRRPNNWIGAKLVFTEVDGQSAYWTADELLVWRKGNSHVLFFWVGEEGGERFVLEKASDNTQTQRNNK